MSKSAQRKLAGINLVGANTINDIYRRIPLYYLQRGRYLSPNAKAVYAALFMFANINHVADSNVYPSRDALAECSGLGRTTVAKALNELEHFRWIKRIKETRNTANGEKNKTFIDFDFSPKHADEKLENELTPYPSKTDAKLYAKANRGKSKNDDGGDNFGEKFKPKNTGEAAAKA